MLPVLVAMGVSVVLTPIVGGMATRLGWLDRPGRRRIHSSPLPRLGGVAIVTAFYAAMAAVLMLDRPAAGNGLERADVALLVGGLLFTALGVVDDLVGVSARRKLLAQLVIAVAVVALGLSIERLATPWGVIDTGWVGAPLTVVWLVGTVNAFNLIDGLDGLAAGVAIVACAALGVVAIGQPAPLALAAVTALAGAALGFLAYNFNPASIIMGDTGSMFLGFVLAGASVLLMTDAAAPVPFVVPLLILALPFGDTAFAIVRRLAGGRSLFRADRDHVHHRLLRRGLSHRATVLALYAVASAFGVIGVAVSAWLGGG